MTTTTVHVTGMTCGHCESAVQKELGGLEGVSDVAVDLGSGAVTITSEGPLDAAQIAAAVDEAGFELAG